MSKQHPDIKFTFEVEPNNILYFTFGYKNLSQKIKKVTILSIKENLHLTVYKFGLVDTRSFWCFTLYGSFEKINVAIIYLIDVSQYPGYPDTSIHSRIKRFLNFMFTITIYDYVI